MSSSSPAVLDPLAAPQDTFPNVGVSVATVPRKERIAPDVTAIGGAEAVALVRAAGFIAAIESVASELAEGTVIEQEPPPGQRLEREGVITLRLAAPPLESIRLATVNEAGLVSDQAEPTAAADDTEEWFRALAPSRPDTPAAPTSGKRHRKHRRATPPARERFFDPPPAPSVEPSEPTVPFLQRTRGRAGLWPRLSSSVCAVAPLLAGLQWRRASALLAGMLLLLALFGTRLFASGDRGAQTAHPRALARTTYTQAQAAKPVRAMGTVARRRVRPSPEPRARHSPMRNGGRDRKRNTVPVALVAARPAHQAHVITPASSAGGQFAYLGQ
jgi:hypothetical protein